MTSLPALAARFDALSAPRKRRVHLAMAELATAAWQAFLATQPRLDYVESVVGTRQRVDPALPLDALRAVLTGSGVAEVEHRYLEPLAALQDDDLELPENVTYAYYALYNLFRKYALRRDVDDWLIVNQALSSELDAARWGPLLEEALAKAEAG